jgi:hypothetical protein
MSIIPRKEETPMAAKPWPHLELRDRYTHLPKAWKSSKRWFSWKYFLEEGEYRVQRVLPKNASTDFTSFSSSWGVAAVTRAVLSGIGYNFSKTGEKTSLVLSLQECRDPQSQETD